MTTVEGTILTSMANFTLNYNEIAATSINYAFSLTLTSSLMASSVIYIIYSENCNNFMSLSCTVSGHNCNALPQESESHFYLAVSS
jgi:hypothetical protein